MQKLKSIFLKMLIPVTLLLLVIFFFNKSARSILAAALSKQLGRAVEKDKKLQQEIDELKKQESEVDVKIAQTDKEISNIGTSTDADWHKK